MGGPPEKQYNVLFAITEVMLTIRAGPSYTPEGRWPRAAHSPWASSGQAHRCIGRFIFGPKKILPLAQARISRPASRKERRNDYGLHKVTNGSTELALSRLSFLTFCLLEEPKKNSFLPSGVLVLPSKVRFVPGILETRNPSGFAFESSIHSWKLFWFCLRLFQHATVK